MPDTKKVEDLIKMLKKHKIRRFKHGDIDIELSELSFLDDVDLDRKLEKLKQTHNTVTKSQSESQDEEDLFYSAY